MATLLLSACVTERPEGLDQRSAPNYTEASRLNTELGAGYARQGLYDLALEKLKKAVEQNGRYALAHSTLAYVYSQRGDAEQAETEYRRALDLDDRDPEIRNQFGVFLCGKGRTAEGDRYLVAAAQDRNYATPEAAWTNAGLCALKAGDNPRAEADFRQALATDAGFGEALVQMATLCVERNDYARGRSFLDRYNQVGKPRADTLMLWARLERGLGDLRAARRYEAQLVQNFPESEEAAQLLKRPTSP